MVCHPKNGIYLINWDNFCIFCFRNDFGLLVISQCYHLEQQDFYLQLEKLSSFQNSTSFFKMIYFSKSHTKRLSLNFLAGFYKRVCPSVRLSVCPLVHYAPSFSAVSTCFLAPHGQCCLLQWMLPVTRIQSGVNDCSWNR